MLLQLVVAAVVYGFGAPKHSNHYLGAIQDKIERLNDCEGPRVVVLGGSNVAFGFHSPLMQESIGLETVNLGLHVSLGLAFPMDCYLQHARRGDIVVLCPEYHLLTSDEHRRGDPRMIDQLLEQCPDAKRYLAGSNQSTWKEFLDHDGLWIAHQWVGRAYRTIRRRDTSEKIYYRSSFNEFGDLVAHHGRPSGNLMPMDPVPPLAPEVIDQSIAMLNEFNQACQSRGVSVYFSYPPLMESMYASSKETIEQLHQSLLTRITIPILNDPDEFAYPRDRFFDSAYHLNREAGEERTRRIAEAIAREHFESTAIAMAN